ncbi:MAG: glycosyltransferase, partial [Gemmatimonadaceae bacterium]|nr:glycosyltransferase [Acetobacteraceae bacterium]
RVVLEPRAIADAAHPVSGEELRRLPPVRGLPGQPPMPDLFARDAARRRRLLVIDGFVPLRVMGAGYPRARALLNQADALGWAVTLYPFDPVGPGWTHTYNEIAPGIEVMNQHGPAGLHAFLQDRSGFYDVVLVSRPEHMRPLRAILDADPALLAGARLVYDAEALFSARQAQRAALDGTPIPPGEQAALLQDELSLLTGVDAVVAVTEHEAAVFRSHGAPVTVLSHPMRPRAGPGFAERRGFLFVGRLLEPGSPNHDGLCWFIQAVWPAIRAALPDAALAIVGAVRADTSDLSGPGITVVGPVSDLDPFYDAARVFVAPARFAAGIPLKVLEAAEAGLPVLTTMLIAGQLDWTGEEIAAADDPVSLAGLAAMLHGDPVRWASMRDAAAARLRRDHGADRFASVLRDLLERDVAVAKRPSA